MSVPRVGFLGTGWIGRHRMAAICATAAVEAAAIVEPDADCLAEARAIAPGARVVPSLEALLDLELDGVVIATPSALHAAQSIEALRSGAAVFCQKPLGRDAREVNAVVAQARSADRLLAVDFSYRHTSAALAVKRLLDRGALGRVYAAELVFHNAYGPDKAWFYDRLLSGGGCVIDLGVHLIDLVLWMLGFPEVEDVRARLHGGGALLGPRPAGIEDFAIAEMALADGVSVRLACSWRLHAGQDAVIDVALFGTHGGAAIRNIGGSFYDFEAVHWQGTCAERLTTPPDEWGGRAAAAWARQLASGARFDPAAERLVEVAAVVDRIYGRDPVLLARNQAARERI